MCLKDNIHSHIEKHQLDYTCQNATQVIHLLRLTCKIKSRFSSIKKRIQIPHLEIYAKKLQLGSKMLKEIMKMLTCKLSYFNSTAHFVVEVCRVVNDINIWVPYPCLKPKISILVIILMTHIEFTSGNIKHFFI